MGLKIRCLGVLGAVAALSTITQFVGVSLRHGNVSRQGPQGMGQRFCRDR
jgi:hypothetical protein